MINLMVCGVCGKMGRVIESCVNNRDDMKIVCGVDITGESYSNFPVVKDPSDFKGEVDVIIDFSHPMALNGLLDYAKSNKTPLVASTTGYSEQQIDMIKSASKDIPIFFSFNMSLGVNLLLDLAKKATAVLGDDFDIEIIESHHNQKIDAPSGTAIMIANAINETAEESYTYEYDRHSKRQKRSPKEIGIHAVRGGTIVGEHEIMFAGRDEIITISHSARSKEVFAVGALNAAKFMHGKSVGLYDMSKLIEAVK